jgi:acyl-CoA thioesterase-2
MHPILDDLINLLKLERIEENIFRGDSRDIGSAQVFGGQVVAQALSAAQSTIQESRIAHSLHAYFLRRGDMESPIIYEVDRSRDGGSFSVRRVVAIQHGRPIFNLAASFHKEEDGLNHQNKMPDVEGPDKLKNMSELMSVIKDKIPKNWKKFLTSERPFEFRPVRPVDIFNPGKLPPVNHVWIRAVNELPNDDHLHQCLLAYVSDFQLLGTSLRPHGFGVPFGGNGIQIASLDHALWIHRHCRVDEWLLYSSESPNASNARGFARGQFFKQDGTLIASVAQEGMIRLRNSERENVPPTDPRLHLS